MSKGVRGAIAAVLVFCVTEVVCRTLLHLSDDVVILIVLPLTFLTFFLVSRIGVRSRH